MLAALVFVSVGYPACYGLARAKHQIVHTRAQTSDAHGHQVVSKHGVVAGDGKWSPLPGLVAIVFTPLRWAELAFWYVIEPEGKPFGLP